MGPDKKKMILQAAIECFTAYGFEKTSMSDIGRLVGLNKASLYYHFKDKQELFNEMVRSRREHYRVAIQAILSSKEDITLRVVDFLCSEIGFIEELAVNFFVSIRENNGLKNGSFPVFTEIVNEILQILVKMISEEKNRGSFAETDPLELAGMVLQTSRGLLEIDCPLDKPVSQRAKAYERVRSDIRKIIPFILKGAGAKT